MGSNLPDNLHIAFNILSNLDGEQLQPFVYELFVLHALALEQTHGPNDLKLDKELSSMLFLKGRTVTTCLLQKIPNPVIHKSLEKGYSLNDISILVRRNSTGSEVAKFLSENDIKVTSQDSLWVSKDIHVKFLVSVLSAVTSQRNVNYQKKCIEHLSALKPDLNAVQMWKEIEEGLIDIRKLLAKNGFNFATFETFHSFYEYAEHLLEAFNFKLDQNPYLQFFLEQIHQFEKRSSTNIRSFVSWFTEKGFKESITSPSGTEAVQVMTFHKSKGLEFPIVICPFLEWDMSKNKSKLWIEDDEHRLPSYSLSPSKKTKLTKYATEMEAEDDKNTLDHINTIYVAFTRAESALFLAGNSSKSSSPAKEWILPFLNTQSTLAIQAGSEETFFLGEFVQKQKANESLPKPFEFDFIKKKMDRTKFSLKGAHEVSFEELDEKRKYGTELHLVLSKIERQNDSDSTLLKALRKGLIKPENLPKLKYDLERLFMDKHFASYFEHTNFHNEKIIIDKDGKTHIPDKIIFKNDEVLIVDYKTGEEQEEKYEQQLQRYIQLLSEMSYKNVRGEIFYTESLHFKPVSAE